MELTVLLMAAVLCVVSFLAEPLALPHGQQRRLKAIAPAALSRNPIAKQAAPADQL